MFRNVPATTTENKLEKGQRISHYTNRLTDGQTDMVDKPFLLATHLLVMNK